MQADPAKPAVEVVFVAHPEGEVRAYKQAIEPLGHAFHYRQVSGSGDLRSLLAGGGIKIVLLRAETEEPELRAAVAACAAVADRASAIVVATHAREECAVALMRSGVSD
ncbi:MAG: hypothetical protein WAO95_05330 [Burkholderiales bacterium]